MNFDVVWGGAAVTAGTTGAAGTAAVQQSFVAAVAGQRVAAAVMAEAVTAVAVTAVADMAVADITDVL